MEQSIFVGKTGHRHSRQRWLVDPQRVHRIQIIHKALERQRRLGGQITEKQLAIEIQHHLGGDRWSNKTIQRDLKVMAEEIGLPVEWDAAAKTFCYRHEAQMAEATLSLLSSLDVYGLLVGRQAMEQYRGTPWYEPLKKTFDRLLATVPSGQVAQYRTITDKIRFEGPQVREMDAGIWNAIQTCLDNNETLLMTYRTGRDGQVRQRHVDPYGLVVVERQWQLIGWDHLAKGVRTFLLTRIQAAEYTGKTFKLRDNFNLDAYLDGSIAGQQSTGKPVKVKLRFTKEGTPAGEAQVWSRHEKRSYDKEGRLIVEFETAALFKVEREVLGWGGKCEVMEPRTLRHSILQGVRQLLRANSCEEQSLCIS